ncbi:MAG: ABC transporter permease, partial [Candidatus Eisenbacteria bacterium]|nr:ABC transporter permease [Candidatus Eisenbacteria bacterium]
MNRILMVARREYIEHVKTKSFIVGIVLLPLLIFASVFIQEMLEK